MGRLAPRYFFVALLALLAFRADGANVSPSSARKTEEKQLYDDGSLHFRVPLNAKGQRHGEFIAYYRGGKIIQQRVRYENGLRTGTRELFDPKHQLIGEELWINGTLVFPKSTNMIEAERKRLLKEAADYVVKIPKPTNPRAPSPEVLARALGKLNFIRYLADLPDDITYDDQYINLCQYAAELLVSVGHLTHTPDKPAGFDEKAFELGREGCGHSNLCQSSGGMNAIESLDIYMHDSDASNIDRVGHRRWVLNPTMRKTGFGDSGNYSAMYSLDRSREEEVDYDFVCYPPRGLCPLNVFRAASAWSLSVNPAKYKISDSATLEIYEVDKHLKHVRPAAGLKYAHVNRDHFGIGNVIIAQPDEAIVRPNVAYEVVVRGVSDAEGNAAAMSYFVSFYKGAQ